MKRWTRRDLLAGAATAPWLTRAAFADDKKKSAAPRPNVVLIVAEDLPATALGCYGNREMKTPNLDALAQAGTMVTTAITGSGAPLPGLASLLTGRTPLQLGMGQDAAPSSGLAQESMVSDALSPAGYKCGFVGSWGLSAETKLGHGFGYSVVVDPSVQGYDNPTLLVNGERKTADGYLPSLITEHASAFIDQQAKGTPFFLVVSHRSVRPPYEGHPQKFVDLYAGTPFVEQRIEPAAQKAAEGKELLSDTVASLRKYAAGLSALDFEVGTLRKKLATKGFVDNTAIIFTSTNGMMLGQHGLWGSARGSETISGYEGVVRVPMIWNWPGEVPVQSARPEVLSHYDLLPTLAEICGANLPGKALCGRNVSKIIQNEPLGKKERWHDLVFSQFGSADLIRDNRYKLILRNNGEGPNEMFDLRSDPRELVNQYENPQYVTVRDEMAAAIRTWREKYPA